MRARKKPFHGLGIILEAIIGGAQIVAQGSATAIQQEKVRKEQRKTSSLLSMLHQQRLTDIQAEGAAREEAIRIKSETSLVEEKGIRTAAYMGVTVAILASMTILYFLLRVPPMRNNFGQIMAVIDMVNQAGFNAAQAVIKTQQAKGEYQLGKKEAELKLVQAQEELKLRDRDYALKVRESERQEALYKDVAIIVGIGITVVMGIIGIGVLVSSKGKTK